VSRKAERHTDQFSRTCLGSGHAWTHEDCSQIFLLVAGWCWVKGPTESAAGWKRPRTSIATRPCAGLCARTGRCRRFAIAVLRRPRRSR
jgi:hypothetical protein